MSEPHTAGVCAQGPAPGTSRALLVLPNVSQLRAAVEAGLDVWAVWHDTGLGPPAYGRERGLLPPDRLLTADFGDVSAVRFLLEDTAGTHGIEHILYLGNGPGHRLAPRTAVAVEGTIRELAAERGRPAAGLPDPVTMRRILNQSNVSVVRARQAHSVAEACALAESFPLPAAVKWAGPSGRSRTALLRDRRDLGRWAERAVAEGLRGPLLIEELLTGPRLCAETLTVAGMHLMVGVTGTAVPLSPAEQTEVRTTVRALLDLAGYESGAARTDVVLTAEGVRILATGEPGRGR